MSSSITNEKIVLTNNFSNQDAFDRLRISESNTLFQYELSLGKLPFFINEFTSGSASITSDSAIPTIDLNLTGIGKAIRQSYEYIPYQPGKSKLILMSGVLITSDIVSDVVSRIGCFDDYVEKTDVAGSGNGLFFELNNKVLYVVKRLNRTVSDGDETRVAQSAWNYDKFDGTGPSGLTLTIANFIKGMIFAIDQEWLGVGRVRFGFIINGLFNLCHSFNHFSTDAINVPYTKTAKLPIRYEISSSSSVTATMRMFSSTVLSEGGYEPVGLNFSIGTQLGKTFTNTTDKKPIVSLKLREEEPYNRKTISMRKLSIIVSTSNAIQWDLYLLPNKNSLTNADWKNNNSDNSIAQYDLTSSAVNLTDAILLISGYANNSTINDFYYNKYLESSLINSSINGTSRVLCLVGLGLTNNNTTAYASISWTEII